MRARRTFRGVRGALTTLLCLAAVFAAGCHRNNLNSGYGLVWVTVSDEPGDFTSYTVNIDSVTLTRNDGAVVSALATPETADFSKLGNLEELWGSATVPTGTYVSASIILDYSQTNANVSVMVNGAPQKATVIGPTGAAVTTVTVNVIFDPANPLVILPTYATTSAVRLAIDFNLAASTPPPDFATNPTTIEAQPYLTAAIAPPDDKLIRIRGPLINSSVTLGTYTVYVRPFYDVYSALGSLTLFTDANTIFAINGLVTTGTAGLSQLSQSSTGTTVTAAYTTFEPTATPSATAGIFHPKYVIAGSTLEDVYTEGLEGDVIARSGNTLTLRGSTLEQNNIGTSSYINGDATVILGSATIVTADDTTLTNLNYNSVAVGQHIIVRGIYTLPASGVTTVDATGNSQTNTGSVRLISTHLWGSLVASNAGSLLLNLETINNWPVSVYNFAGNGSSAANDPVAANFPVNPGAIAVPAVVPPDPLWIDGLFTPFGAAPPAFTASSINDELGVQTAGANPANTAPAPPCGTANPDCVPASLRAYWGAGTAAPFSTLSATSMVVDLGNAALTSAVVRIGPESIDLKALGTSPTIIPTAAPAAVTATASGAGATAQTLPPLFLPSYSYGNPTAVAPAGINVFSAFSTFAAGLPAAITASPAHQFEARGVYNRTTNTFTAISVAVVL